jgi:hypothetical protein
LINSAGVGKWFAACAAGVTEGAVVAGVADGKVVADCVSLGRVVELPIHRLAPRLNPNTATIAIRKFIETPAKRPRQRTPYYRIGQS